MPSANLSAAVADGAILSLPSYAPPTAWLPVQVPRTLAAAYQDAGLIAADVFQGTQLADVDVALMPQCINSSVWWRGTFTLPAAPASAAAQLVFHGINYKANVFVNGQQLGDAGWVQGAYRRFEFPLPATLAPRDGQSANAVAVEVFAAVNDVFPPINNSTDLSPSFIDWSRPPPDRNMGLWRAVELVLSPSPVVLDPHPVVETQLQVINSTLTVAHITVGAVLSNQAPEPVNGSLLVALEAVTAAAAPCRVAVALAPHETRLVLLSNLSCPALAMANAPLWYPFQMGEPRLLALNITFEAAAPLASPPTLTVRTGLRQVTTDLDAHGSRRFFVNNRRFFVRGAGWASDLFQRSDPARLQAQLAYVRHMGLNLVRLEGQFEPDVFFEQASELGLMVMPGLPCCNSFQHWPAWSNTTVQVARATLASLVQRLRRFPANLVFLYGSDLPPPPFVEHTYLGVFEAEHWPAPVLSAAAAATTVYGGPSGVKMNGPYDDFVPPNYWSDPRAFALGGAAGFATEISAAAGPMLYSTLQTALPPADLWPINADWFFHCGNPRGLFRNNSRLQTAMTARYGAAVSAQDYSRKAQLLAYEANRAMLEAYSANKDTGATGIVVWMLNSAWLQMSWNLFSYDLAPTGAFFGVRAALQPATLTFQYATSALVAINSGYTAVNLTQAEACLFSRNGSLLLLNSTQPLAQLPPDSSTALRPLALPAARTETTFLRLQLLANGTVVSRSVYWLPAAFDVVNYTDPSPFFVAVSQSANMTDLGALAPASVHALGVTLNNTNAAFVLSNGAGAVAFFVHLRIVADTPGGQTMDVQPILWSDNFITLLPNEQVSVSATFAIPASWTNSRVLVCPYNSADSKLGSDSC